MTRAASRQDLVGEDSYEKWVVNGRVFLVEVRAKKNGFEVWSAGDSNLLAEYFSDAESRIGLRADARDLTDDEKHLLDEALYCGVELRRSDRPEVSLDSSYVKMYRSIAQKTGAHTDLLERGLVKFSQKDEEKIDETEKREP